MKSFKKIFNILLLIILILPSTAFADAKLKNYVSSYDDIDIIDEIFYIKNEPFDKNRFIIHTIVENNDYDVAYCLQKSKGAQNNSLGKINARDYVLNEQGTKLSASQLELLKNILASGYQKNSSMDSLLNAIKNDSYTNNDKEIAYQIYATQLLTWEVVEGLRTGYNDASYSATNTDNTLKFVKDNPKLKSAYDSILKKAATLASGNKPAAFGKTYVMHWSDSTNSYSISKINVSDYKVASFDKNKLSVTKDKNNAVTITSTKEITGEEQVTFNIVQGSTLQSADGLRIFVFNDNPSENQELALSNYRGVQTGELSVKTESGKIKLTKQDSTTKKNIKGAVFELYKCNSNFTNCSTKVTTIDMKNKTVSSDVTITKSGNYLLKETVVPVGYDKMDDITMTLTIDDNGKVKVSNSKVSYNDKTSVLNLVLYNDQKVFNIKKIDGNNNKEIKGATFQIKDSKGNVIKFKKDKDGKYIYDTTGSETSLVSSNLSTYSVSLLPVGEYILEETDAPADYVLPTSTTERQTKFKIDKDNFLMAYNYSTKKYAKSPNLTITAKNFKTRVKIHKTGLKNAPIRGVVFELYDSKKENQIPLTLSDGVYTYNSNSNPMQLVTNSKGYIIINSLESGTYYLKEISTPEDSGLVLDPNNIWTKITISVKRDSATEYNFVKEIRNAKGTFCFYKIDEDGNYLDSGKFKLQMYNTTTSKFEDKQLKFNENDKTYSIDSTNKSNLYIFSPISEGQTCFVDINAKGRYRIVELEAPEGFVLPSSSEAMAEIEINEYGYASGDAVIMNRKMRTVDDASAQAELIISIQTGQKKIHYLIIISSIVAIIAALIIINKKIDKK